MYFIQILHIMNNNMSVTFKKLKKEKLKVFDKNNHCTTIEIKMYYLMTPILAMLPTLQFQDFSSVYY